MCRTGELFVYGFLRCLCLSGGTLEEFNLYKLRKTITSTMFPGKVLGGAFDVSPEAFDRIKARALNACTTVVVEERRFALEKKKGKETRMRRRMRRTQNRERRRLQNGGVERKSGEKRRRPKPKEPQTNEVTATNKVEFQPPAKKRRT